LVKDVHIQDLSPIKKLECLKSCLSGEAKQAISAVEINNLNYNLAWNLLETKFHNSQLLIEAHVKSLFDAPPLIKESPAQIRELINTVSYHINALKNLNEPTDSWDPLVIHLIVSKFHSIMDRKWKEYKNNYLTKIDHQKIKLDYLITFLKMRADVLDTITTEDADTLCSHSEPKPDLNAKINNYPKVQKKTQSLHAETYITRDVITENASNNFSTRACPICGDNHSLYSCHGFLNLSIYTR
jgi:hypothetical protein